MEMNDEELLTECKIGLNIPVSSTALDGVLRQKVLAIKSYMLGAGVSEDLFTDPLAVGVIVMGVTDIWNLTGGDINLSPVFNTLLTQLAVRSKGGK